MLYMWLLCSQLAASLYGISGYADVDQPRSVDILFLVDITRSMGPYIRTLASSVPKLAESARLQGLAPRYAIATIYESPDIIQPFVANDTLTALNLNSIATSGTRESSLEAIRMALRNEGSEFAKACKQSTYSCSLKWSSVGKRAIVLVTDEDSDLPINATNRMPGQTGLCQFNYTNAQVCPYAYVEPDFKERVYYAPLKTFVRSENKLTLPDPWVSEINATARMLVDSEVVVHTIIRSDLNPATLSKSGPVSYFDARNLWWTETRQSASDALFTSLAQFGDPASSVQSSEFAAFDARKTLDSLRERGVGSSLQAQVLAAGGNARVFSLMDTLDPRANASQVRNVFRALVQDLTEKKPAVSPPTTSSPSSTQSVSFSSVSESSEKTTPSPVKQEKAQRDPLIPADPLPIAPLVGGVVAGVVIFATIVTAFAVRTDDPVESLAEAPFGATGGHTTGTIRAQNPTAMRNTANPFYGW